MLHLHLIRFTNMSSSTALVLAPESSERGVVKVVPARWLVLAAFAAVYVIWGSTYLGIRLAIDSIPPFLMAGARFLIAGLILYGVMIARGVSRPTVVHWKNAFVVGSLLLLAGNGGMTWATQFVPTNLAALLIAGTPLWILVIDWMRPNGTRPTNRVFAGLALGFAGVGVMVAAKNQSSAGLVSPVATIVILLSSVCWAAGSVYSRHARKPDSALLFVAMQMIAGGLLLLVLGSRLGELHRFDWGKVTAVSMLAFFYLTIFGSLVGFTAYVWLLQVSTPAKVSTYAYVNPMIALVLGRVVLGEVLARSTLIAGMLILAAVVLCTLSSGRKPESE